jgi:hypothetical protein
MKKQRKTQTKEFKIEAVRLADLQRIPGIAKWKPARSSR